MYVIELETILIVGRKQIWPLRYLLWGPVVISGLRYITNCLWDCFLVFHVGRIPSSRNISSLKINTRKLLNLFVTKVNQNMDRYNQDIYRLTCITLSAFVIMWHFYSPKQKYFSHRCSCRIQHESGSLLLHFISDTWSNTRNFFLIMGF